MLLQLPFIKTQENLYKNVNENMFSFTFLCKFSCFCNFAIFVRIFMKFSLKCRPKKLGMICTSKHSTFKLTVQLGFSDSLSLAEKASFLVKRII